MAYRSSPRARHRILQQARHTSNLPDLSRHVQDLPPEPPAAAPQLRTSPVITPVVARLEWWQVYRIEQHGEERCEVLIAQCRTEREGWAVMLAEAWACRLTRFAKWTQRRDSDTRYRPVRVVPVDAGDNGSR